MVITKKSHIDYIKKKKIRKKYQHVLLQKNQLNIKEDNESNEGPKSIRHVENT